MVYMNNKHYWKFRNVISRLCFLANRLFFRFNYSLENRKADIPFSFLVIKFTIIQAMKSLFLASIIWCADGLILLQLNDNDLNTELLLDAVIGGIGVAGVILGLYCANISSVYTTKFSEAPKKISDAFQNDQLTQKCIGKLIQYIIYGIIVIAEILFNTRICWATAITILIWSIMVIVSYCLAGNRTYQLSNIYSVADDTYRSIDRTIHKGLASQKWSSDINFQNHFLKITEKDLELLYSIQTYGSKSSVNDYSPLYSFMRKNLACIYSYWKVKPSLGKESFWYKNEKKYQKWHFTDSTQVEIALNTGTSLIPKNEHDYYWFEKALFSINLSCLKEMIKQGEYEFVYRYLLFLCELTEDAISAKEITYYMGEVDKICCVIKEEILKVKDKDHENVIVRITEAISLIYLGLFLKAGEYCRSFNIYKTVSDVIHSIDSTKSIEKAPILRGREFNVFYKRILLEKKIEGKRITPDWVIKQLVAQEEFIFVNSLLRNVADGMNTILDMGKQFSDNDHLLEGCIVLSRFYEFESKYNHAKISIEKTMKELESYHLDNEQKWDEPIIDYLEKVVAQWKREIPMLLRKSSTFFTIQNWKRSEDYPDFLGECFNHICEDAIDAIICNDIEQFKLDYENLTKLVLLYQDYIKTDFRNLKDSYRLESAFYIITSPIAEWAQIGGLAILWGEFHSDSRWKLSVNDVIPQIINPKDENDIISAERMIEYAKARESYIFAVSNRDLLETGWNMRVANALRDSGLCQKEYWEYGSRLKTDSILLKVFCPDFWDFGFMTDPAEVFWILCINPLLSDDKKYHSRSSWEDKMNGK